MTITAIAGAVRAVRHSVDYLATAKSGRRGGTHVLLAQANWWTVAAGNADQASPAPDRSRRLERPTSGPPAAATVLGSKDHGADTVQ